MKYTVTTLVDGSHVSTNRFVLEDDLEYHTELAGPDLHDFTTALMLTGQAMNVRRDAVGVTVVIAHEEI
jgi:hypothetical protein